MNSLKGWDSSLTEHGAQRLKERTSLTEADFLALIDGGKSVPVGIEPRTNRLHRLVFSNKDESHFVAVQDMANGEVITILTLEYHENLAWKLSQQALDAARRLVGRREFARTSATHLKLRAVFAADASDLRSPLKIKNLGSIPLMSIDQPLESLDSSLIFCAQVKQRLEAKSIDPATVRRIIGHVGKQPTPEALFEYGVDFLMEGASVDSSA